MASLRRRSILKLLVVISLFWLAMIGLMVTKTGGGIGGPDNIQQLPNVIQRIMQKHNSKKAARPFKQSFDMQQQQQQPQPLQPVLQIKEGVHLDTPIIHEADHKHPPESEGRKQIEKLVDHKNRVLDLLVEDTNNTGELGNPVIVDKNKLSREERKKYDLGWKNNGFNLYASDMISLDRTLRDVRDEGCKSMQYKTEQPDTSVVIIFHNEAWSVLLRTVFSVLHRSPPHLIREVILVDDFSDFDHLKRPLDDFVASQPKLRLVRANKREGLIRARLKGAAVAKGETLTFLDSHCECAIGWLEPLMDRIADNRSNVVTPSIDTISDETLAYRSSTGTQIGGFDWGLRFTWHGIPDHEKKRRKRDTDPIRSPTMAGGLFSIDRKYFEYLGTYDSGMEIWGGENLELSFRIWMCGGSLEVHPCSHVGHIFRKHSPMSSSLIYGRRNYLRLAEVWMDDYKKYYYEKFSYALSEYGDVSSRKKLRKDLKCKSFDWYIRNIYPDIFIPGEALASGQLWMLSKASEIRKTSACMDYTGLSLTIYECHGSKGNQEWVYEQDNTLRQKYHNRCIEISEDGQTLEMKPCTGIDRQIWEWRRKTQAEIEEQSLRGSNLVNSNNPLPG